MCSCTHEVGRCGSKIADLSIPNSAFRRVSIQHHVPADLPLCYLLKRSCVGIWTSLDVLKKKNLSLPWIRNQFFGHPARSLATLPTRLSHLQIISNYAAKCFWEAEISSASQNTPFSLSIRKFLYHDHKRHHTTVLTTLPRQNNVSRDSTRGPPEQINTQKAKIKATGYEVLRATDKFLRRKPNKNVGLLPNIKWNVNRPILCAYRITLTFSQDTIRSR
jgi:hypothetical protein